MQIKTALPRTRLGRRLATIAALSASAIALVPAAAQAYQYEVHESSGRTETNLSVKANQRVNIVADPTRRIENGWWFSSNGPDGWGTAGSNFPMPGAKAFSLVARVGHLYHYVGNGTEFWAGTDGPLTLFINDDVPGNGKGYFGVESVRIHTP